MHALSSRDVRVDHGTDGSDVQRSVQRGLLWVDHGTVGSDVQWSVQRGLHLRRGVDDIQPRGVWSWAVFSGGRQRLYSVSCWHFRRHDSASERCVQRSVCSWPVRHLWLNRQPVLRSLCCWTVQFNWGGNMHALSRGDIWCSDGLDNIFVHWVMRRRILRLQFRAKCFHVQWFVYRRVRVSCRLDVSKRHRCVVCFW